MENAKEMVVVESEGDFSLRYAIDDPLSFLILHFAFRIFQSPISATDISVRGNSRGLPFVAELARVWPAVSTRPDLWRGAIQSLAGLLISSGITHQPLGASPRFFQNTG